MILKGPYSSFLYHPAENNEIMNVRSSVMYLDNKVNEVSVGGQKQVMFEGNVSFIQLSDFVIVTCWSGTVS